MIKRDFYLRKWEGKKLIIQRYRATIWLSSLYDKMDDQDIDQPAGCLPKNQSTKKRGDVLSSEPRALHPHRA